ncbi:zinc-binding alcohol dehydrogenase [Micrococcales bacterium 31B]|nr:zinc-binding alcohol dehydrogenase [Micrococcales bacterium 31B]
MPNILRFAAPHAVEIVAAPEEALPAGHARVRTLYSGISAGTELTAYRGTNPYLTSRWDPTTRLFTGAPPGPPAYPLDGWGYSEVGVVIEISADAPGGADPIGLPRVGDTVWGIWGHRSEGVLPLESLRGHVLPGGADPLAASFVRVGAIALNAVLQADLNVGSTVAIVGQGVIGLLATSLAAASGATVYSVDAVSRRREESLRRGACRSFGVADDPALALRESHPEGVDVAIEFSGTYPGLVSATRLVGADGVVVAAGFYQGEGTPLRLGNEFHHNRVQVLASQIGAVPTRLRARWDVARLQRVVLDRIAAGTLDTESLVTHRFALHDAAAAFALLDAGDGDALQVILECAS